MALIREARAERDFNGRHLLQRRTASRFSMIYAITMWSVEVRRRGKLPVRTCNMTDQMKVFGKVLILLHAFPKVRRSVLRWKVKLIQMAIDNDSFCFQTEATGDENQV
jgi:hypothetical protein